MTFPRKAVGYLGVVQALLAVYSVLAVNFYLAARPAAHSAFANAFADYGVLLCLVPLTWTVMSIWSLGRQAPRRTTASLIFWSWLAITLLMLGGDIFLTVHVINPSAALKI